jgi:hypothetical protein
MELFLGHWSGILNLEKHDCSEGDLGTLSRFLRDVQAQ